MRDFEEYLNEQLKDPEFRAEYEKAGKLLELVTAIHNVVLPFGYEVGTEYEEGDIIHVILQRGENNAK